MENDKAKPKKKKSIVLKVHSVRHTLTINRNKGGIHGKINTQ